MSEVTAFDAPQTRILGAWFHRIDHRDAAMGIAVFAENLTIAGAQLFARVGRQSVANLIPIPDGRGFTGTLTRVPSEGDRLYLQYLGGLEHRTEVTYRAGGGAPAVA